MTRVVLRKDALVAIIVAAIEVFKKECYGLLLGEKKRNLIIIKDAFGFQTAMRNYYSSSVFEFREKRVNNTLKYLTALKLVGDFHSHTNGSENLSDADKKFLRQAGSNYVSLLVVINKTRKTTPWKYNARKKCLSGSIGRKFFVKIQAFVYDENADRVKKVRLSFPRKKELNKRMRHFSKLEIELEKVKKEERKTVRKKRLIKAKLGNNL